MLQCFLYHCLGLSSISGEVHNSFRPHSALGYQTPQQYAQQKRNQSDGACAAPNPAPLAAAGVQGEPRARPCASATRKPNNEIISKTSFLMCPFSGVRPALPFNERKATQAAAHFLKLAGGKMDYRKLMLLLYFADWMLLLTFPCNIGS